jgi:hypothetical protein
VKVLEEHKLKKIWKNLTQGWKGDLFYAILGIILAFLFYKALGLAFKTDLPIVAVVTSSMQHDNPEITFYGWLENHLNYNRSYINSWPLINGFSVGDMLFVVNDGDYKVGDVIVYSVPGEKVPIVHRIVKINEDGTFQTKGDNNQGQLWYEYSVKREQIHGKVYPPVVPKLGYFKLIIMKIFGVY